MIIFWGWKYLQIREGSMVKSMASISVWNTETRKRTCQRQWKWCRTRAVLLLPIKEGNMRLLNWFFTSTGTDNRTSRRTIMRRIKRIESLIDEWMFFIFFFCYSLLYWMKYGFGLRIFFIEISKKMSRITWTEDELQNLIFLNKLTYFSCRFLILSPTYLTILITTLCSLSMNLSLIPLTRAIFKA